MSIYQIKQYLQAHPHLPKQAMEFCRMSRTITPSRYLFFSLPVRLRPGHSLKVEGTAPSPPSDRSFHSSLPCSQDDLANLPQDRPRWQAPPPRMVSQGPRARPFNAENAFLVNEDPKLLDKTYVRVLGKNGDEMLTDEVKWLAVTHKSFDHGRRGFNDRLAFLGRCRRV